MAAVAAISVGGCGSSVAGTSVELSGTGPSLRPTVAVSSSVTSAVSATSTVTANPSVATTTSAQSTTVASVGLSEATLSALAGRQFQGAGPVAPVRFRLEADGTLQASYGCNSGEGTASIINGRLVVSELSRTEMGCDPARMQQDDAIVAMLVAGPTITIEGTTLVLTDPKLTLRLDEQFAVLLIEDAVR